MAADLCGDGFKSVAELIELDDKSAQSVRFAVADAVLFDDGAQFGSPVEGGFGDTGTLGDSDEGDGLTCFDQLGAGRLNSNGHFFFAHADWTSAMSRSRRSMRRRWRAASSPQPRASASAISAWVSTRWVSSVGKKVTSERKFGQCSQMLV